MERLPRSFQLWQDRFRKTDDVPLPDWSAIDGGATHPITSNDTYDLPHKPPTNAYWSNNILTVLYRLLVATPSSSDNALDQTMHYNLPARPTNNRSQRSAAIQLCNGRLHQSPRKVCQICLFFAACAGRKAAMTTVLNRDWDGTPREMGILGQPSP
jgi:hypothetical protein